MSRRDAQQRIRAPNKITGVARLCSEWCSGISIILTSTSCIRHAFWREREGAEDSASCRVSKMTSMFPSARESERVTWHVHHNSSGSIRIHSNHTIWSIIGWEVVSLIHRSPLPTAASIR